MDNSLSARILVPVVLLFLFTAYPGRSADAPGPAATGKKAGRAVLAKVTLRRQVLDFGEIYEGQRVKRRVTIRNANKAPVTIVKAFASCACTKVLLDQKVIPARGSLKVAVSFNAYGLQGKQTKEIFFRFKDVPKGLLKGKVKARVKPVPAELMLSPKTAHLGTVWLGQDATTEVRISNLTNRYIEITRIETDTPGIHGWLKDGKKRIPSGEDKTIVVKVLSKSLKRGSISANLTVFTTLPLHHAVRIPVRGTARKPKKESPKVEK